MVTFDDVPMVTETEPVDTVMVCLGLDCNTTYLVYDIPPVWPPPGCVGFSRFYATRVAAGLVWNYPDGTTFAAPQWGYFHGLLSDPQLLVAVPPPEVIHDHEAVRSWFRDQAAALPSASVARAQCAAPPSDEVARQVSAGFAAMDEARTPKRSPSVRQNWMTRLRQYWVSRLRRYWMSRAKK